MNLPVSLCYAALLLCCVYCVDGCDFVDDMDHCNNNLTINYFYAGSNMTDLCSAAETFIRCVDAYPESCRKLPQYFEGIRWLNYKVTIDDCPDLLKADVPANTTAPPATSPTCVCAAAPPLRSSPAGHWSLHWSQYLIFNS